MFHPNQQIGPYSLIRKLGKGAFGEVWLAEKRSQFFAKKVAIKLPHDDQINFDAISQEATLWEQASGHPNVLPIIDADIYDDQIVIVSEYAEGGSLDDRLKFEGGLSVEQALEITVGILNGLEYLHDKRIIHRDIKPQNVLLQGNIPRLADFGISRAMQSTIVSAAIAGTDAYMSPESFDGKRNARTDIWSVGVVLYQLLNGNLPFPQSHPSERMFAILTKEYEPLPDRLPSVLHRIVGEALAKDPADRYQTAREMGDDLKKVLVAIKHPTRVATEVLGNRPIAAIATELLNNTPPERPVPGTTQFSIPVEPVIEPVDAARGFRTPTPEFNFLNSHSETDRRASSRQVKIFARVALAIALVFLTGFGIFVLRRLGTFASSPNRVDGEPAAVAATPSPDDSLAAPVATSPTESPTPTPSPTTAPTPPVNGKYGDRSNMLSISGADKKGFEFDIEMRTSAGTGDINGRALWTATTTAVYSEIPGKEIYNDPEDPYSRKGCKLTFRFSGRKIKVTEDSYDCQPFHGKSVSFNGMYAHYNK